MGKIASALERYQKEIKAARPSSAVEKPRRMPAEDPEAAMAHSRAQIHAYDDKLVVLKSPHSLDAENFKVLRARLLFSHDRERPKTILITSALPAEGKTFVAANLALSIALGIDEHVLLVDCDLRRPRIHEMLGYPNIQGLHEHLTGRKSLPELIVRTEINKLSFLPAGTLPLNPTELLSSTAMEEFLQEVRGRYQDRFIVIDSAPVQATAEAGVLARYVDGIVFVIRALQTPRRAIQQTLGILGKDKVLGVFYNGYDKTYKSYSKYYKKYYKS